MIGSRKRSDRVGCHRCGPRAPPNWALPCSTTKNESWWLAQPSRTGSPPPLPPPAFLPAQRHGPSSAQDTAAPGSSSAPPGGWDGRRERGWEGRVMVDNEDRAGLGCVRERQADWPREYPSSHRMAASWAPLPPSLCHLLSHIQRLARPRRPPSCLLFPLPRPHFPLPVSPSRPSLSLSSLSSLTKKTRPRAIDAHNVRQLHLLI